MKRKVAVIGVGTVGSMALWQLAKKGIDVTGFEQFGIGHDRSAIGGESRLFRTAYREGAEYVPLLRSAKELWRELEQESGNSLLTLNGGLTIAKATSENFRNVLKSIQDYNIAYEAFDVDEARKQFPQHNFFDDEAVLIDKEAGFLRPELAVVSAVNQAEKHGATVYRHTKVSTIEQTGSGVTITANGQTYDFDDVIVAAGAWAQHLMPQYKQIIEPRRIIMSWFIQGDLSQFQADNFPTFARTTEKYDFFGAPTIDQNMVKIALVGSDEPIEHPDELDHNVRIEETYQQIDIARNYFNGINPDPVRLSVHLDAYTPDEHAMVGRLHDTPDIIVMTGYSGHGFKLAPVMGEIASDLVIDGKTNHYTDHLDPQRFKQKITNKDINEEQKI